MTLQFDHLVIAVPDLDVGTKMLDDSIGLPVLAGGRHPGHGTANAIAPLGDAYLEFVTVVKPEEARGSVFGQAVTQRLDNGGGLMAVCLRTQNLEALAQRLGVAPVEMQRVRPDGVTLRWRQAGLDHAVSAGLPFFIEWAVPDNLQPGYREPALGSIDWVEIPASAAAVQSWLGPTRLDIRPSKDALRAGLSVNRRSVTL